MSNIAGRKHNRGKDALVQELMERKKREGVSDKDLAAWSETSRSTIARWRREGVSYARSSTLQLVTWGLGGRLSIVFPPKRRRKIRL